MRKLTVLIVIYLGFYGIIMGCKKKEITQTVSVEANKRNINQYSSKIPFDSTFIAVFFKKYPKIKMYQHEVNALYKKHQFHYVWYDNKGINELADLLNSKINTIESDGIKTTIPYKNELEAIFQNNTDIEKPNLENELLISSFYFFYADKVLNGLDVKTTNELEWYLPRKKLSYVNYLDSLKAHPDLINKDEKEVLSQYYRLKTVLQKYREIEKKEVWDSIAVDSKMPPLVVGDSSTIVSKIRQRLFAFGYLNGNSKSNVYDTGMANGVVDYKKSIGIATTNKITSSLIKALNIPIAKRIQTIAVNMERCRWIPGDINKAKEFIVINIPSFQLTYFKKGKPVLRSNVVVGKAMNQTVVFSGMMQYIVLSPYWNVPQSIIEKEIAPAMAKNKNYLTQHDMEWNKGNIRQKPGPKNSLGLIKFLFPNSNSIYLHDTPSKNLFNEEKRAFSHGCIRVQKPVELASLILEEDSNWTPEKIYTAMHTEKESWYTLKQKIPVYIGYFTAWVNDEGIIHFFDDVYQRDDRLAALIFEKQ